MKNALQKEKFSLQRSYLKTAVSVAEKMEYWKGNDAQITILESYLDRYPEVKAAFDQIVEARNNPEVAQKLVKQFKTAKGKRSSVHTEDDSASILLAGIVFAQNNDCYLSPEVIQAIQNDQDHFKGFGGGEFGGSGSGGSFDSPNQIQNEYQQNVVDYTPSAPSYDPTPSNDFGSSFNND